MRVRSHDTLARGKRGRLEHAGILYAEERWLRLGRERDTPKPETGGRMEKPGVAQNFAHAELVVAGFDGGGMVSAQAESASGIGCRYGGGITESENGVERFVAQRLHGGGGGFF